MEVINNNNSFSKRKDDLEVGYHGNFGENYFDYAPRAQWLRAVVLGCNEGILFTTMFILGAAKNTLKNDAFIVKGVLGLVFGALTMAISEYVSVNTQVYIVKSQNDRDLRLGKVGALQRFPPPSPLQIGIAASVSYFHGGLLPLLLIWGVKNHHHHHDAMDGDMIFCVAAILATLSMCFTGILVGRMGKMPLFRSLIRVVIGGWTEIGVMLGKIKVFQLYGL